MKDVVIERGDGYTVTSFGNGLSYLIKRESDGKEVFLQGEDATLWRDDYDQQYADHDKPNTRASRFTWRELMDELCGAYFM